MRDSRPWIAHLATVGICFLGVGCGGGGVPDPSSDPSAAVDAPPPPVSGEAPSSVSAPAPAAPAKPAAPQVAQNEPAPAPVEAAPVAAPAPAQPGNDQPAVAATPAPGEGATTGEEKPAVAAKGDASGTQELLNLSNNANNAAPPAEATKEEAPGPGSNPGAMPPTGGGPAMMAGPMVPPGPPGQPGRGTGFAAEGGPGMPGMPGMPGGPGMAGMPGMPGGPGGADTNAPPNYMYPITGATTFLNAVKAKNKDRIADATALHAPKEAHNVAMQKLFSQIVDLSVSDAQVDDLAKALQGYTIMGTDLSVSSGRQKVVLGKSNGSNGQFRRTITMRREAKGWKVCDISGQSEIQGMGILRPGARRR